MLARDQSDWRWSPFRPRYAVAPASKGLTPHAAFLRRPRTHSPPFQTSSSAAASTSPSTSDSAELRLERAEEALRHANRGLEVGRVTGQGVTVTTWLGVTSHAALLKGQVADALQDHGHAAIDTERLLANDWRTIWALEADALAAFWAGDSDRALASAREMATRARTRDLFLADRRRYSSQAPNTPPTTLPPRKRQAHRARRRASPASTRPQRRPRMGAADGRSCAGPKRPC